MTLAQITGISPPASEFANSQTLVSDIISKILIYAIAGAGFYFMLRLITAGFSMLTSVGEPGKIQSAKKQLTNAIIGLIIVTTAFFIGQMIEMVFGIRFTD